MEISIGKPSELTHYDLVLNRLQRMSGRQKNRSTVQSGLEFMNRIRQRSESRKSGFEQHLSFRHGTTFDASPELAGPSESIASHCFSVEPDVQESLTQHKAPVLSVSKLAYDSASTRTPINLYNEIENEDLVFNACAIVNSIQNLLIR